MRSGLLKGEWGQGSWYTGPSPLGDSPAVILCLGEPSTSSSLPPTSSSLPTQVTLPLLFVPPSLWWEISTIYHAKTLPWAMGTWREDLIINTFEKKNLSLLLFRHPPPQRPWRPLFCQRCLCHRTCFQNHTLVNSHGSFQSPPITTNGTQNFWAWSKFLFCFCYFTFVLCWLFVRSMGVTGMGVIK